MFPTLEVFVTPLSVATLAESMMQDAWNVFSSEGSSAPADKVAIFGNTDIRRLSKVSYMYKYFCSAIIHVCTVEATWHNRSKYNVL